MTVAASAMLVGRAVRFRDQFIWSVRQVDSRLAEQAAPVGPGSKSSRGVGERAVVVFLGPSPRRFQANVCMCICLYSASSDAGSTTAIRTRLSTGPTVDVLRQRWPLSFQPGLILCGCHSGRSNSRRRPTADRWCLVANAYRAITVRVGERQVGRGDWVVRC